MIIYKITNQVNGKIYIGCTVAKLQRRWRQHVNVDRGYSLNLAIRKYGADSFSQEIIETVDSLGKMFEREVYWIAFYKSNISGVGYNMTKGGEVPEPLIGEQHPNYGKPNPRWAAIGEARKGVPLKGEQLEKVRVSNVGRVRSDEYKNNMSKAMKIRRANGEGYENAGDKISASKKGKPSGKRTLILCLNNNKVYDHYQDAAKKLGIPGSNISAVVNGKAKHSRRYVFKKVTEEHLIF